MAEFDELDGVLRDVLQRAAQPGDSTGVADAIRSRVAAGDPGASVASSSAPGWGSGVFSWMPWLGLIVVAGLVGGGLGVAGVFGAPQEQIVAGYTVVLDDTAPAYSCPGGGKIGSLSAGARVLAIARSDDSAWLGVRDPNAFTRTLWFERSVVVLDPGQGDVAALPVEACPEVTVTAITPTPTEAPVPEETHAPPAPGDTTKPTIGQQFATPHTTLYQDESTVIHAFAADNVGVSSVSIVWSGAASGSSTMTHAGGAEWTFPFSRGTGPNGQVTFTLRAIDAAGNQSAPVTLVITLDSLD